LPTIAGVAPGQIVGLYAGSGCVLQANAVACRRCRGCRRHAVERLQVCLDDANGAGVLTCAAFAARLAQLGRPVDGEALLAGQPDAAALAAAAAAELVRAAPKSRPTCRPM
jgi:hypothetical protein